MRWSRRRRTTVAVIGYDLKFFEALGLALDARDALQLRTLDTRTLHAFPLEEIRRTIVDADVVVAEFFGPYVDRLGELLTPDQGFVVRLHRFELHRGFADGAATRRVDRLVCVNEHYRDLVAERNPSVRNRLTVIPNAIDVTRFDVAKLPEARITVGMIGVASQRKRLDLALDILEGVRSGLPGATLRIKGRRPEELKWVMDDSRERAYLDGIRDRVAALERTGALVWSPHGGDVDAWLRGVGFVLSTSDDESFHLSPAEGMASGAVPVIRRWPGAETVYADEWLWREPDEAVHRILALAGDVTEYEGAAERARTEVRRFDVPHVVGRWEELIRTVRSERSGQ